jgi:hypothetical protein
MSFVEWLLVAELVAGCSLSTSQQQQPASNFLRSRDTGIIICSRYFATVRRATLKPFL